jgi:hypothetical protein
MGGPITEVKGQESVKRAFEVRGRGAQRPDVILNPPGCSFLSQVAAFIERDKSAEAC